MTKILAVDDDERILRLIKNVLALNYYDVTTMNHTLNQPIQAFQGFDLVLLDVMMPDIDGFALCAKIRNHIDCPILFLTAKTGEDSVVKGLMNGADDYIIKPFGVQELGARVEAHLRRENRKKHAGTLLLGEIEFDLNRRAVKVNGVTVELTKNQYNICELLASNKGKVLTKEQIYEEVYSIDSDTLISTITEHIRIIRKKFKEVDREPIETIWGVGYMWK